MADERTTRGDELTLEPAPSPNRPSRRRALWGALAAVVVAAGALVVVAGGDGDGPPALPVSLSAGRTEAAGSMAADMSMAWVTYVAGEGLPSLGGEAPAYRFVVDVDEAAVRRLAAALGLDAAPTEQDGHWSVVSDAGMLDVDSAGGSWWYSSTAGSVGGGTSSSGSGSGSAGCEQGPAVDCGFDTPVSDDATATTTTLLERAVAPSVECPDGGCATAEPTEPPCDGTVCTTTLEYPACEPGTECIEPLPVEPLPVEPVPAADLPSEDEARSIALDLLRATGAALDDAEVTVDGPYDAWYVTVQHAVEGRPVSGWMSSVGVGPEGAVLNASGMLATPERLGDYPLLDTRATIDRLNAQQAIPVGDDPLGAPEPAVAEAGTAEDGAASAPVTSPCNPEAAPDDPARCAELSTTTVVGGACAGPSGPASDDPAATTLATTCTEPDPGTVVGDPMPAPEPMEIVLTEAEPALVLLWASDGSSDVYLVPGYRFGNADGVQVEAVAVDDESLAPTTVPETTHPDEPAGTEPAPAPADCEVLVEDDGAGTTHTIQTCPTTTVAATEPRPLEPGEEPAIGVAYNVDVLTGALSHCGFISVELGGRWWWADGIVDDRQAHGWAEPTEGGTLTLVDEGEATFVGDAQATKVATLVPYGRPGERPLCV